MRYKDESEIQSETINRFLEFFQNFFITGAFVATYCNEMVVATGPLVQEIVNYKFNVVKISIVKFTLRQNWVYCFFGDPESRVPLKLRMD